MLFYQATVFTAHFILLGFIFVYLQCSIYFLYCIGGDCGTWDIVKYFASQWLDLHLFSKHLKSIKLLGMKSKRAEIEKHCLVVIVKMTRFDFRVKIRVL